MNPSATGNSVHPLVARGRGDAFRRGFTLLELVLVLLVAALLLSMATPALRGFIAGRHAQRTADELLAMTRLARSLAVSEGRTYRLHVDLENGELWLSNDELADDEALPVSLARPVVLAEDVELLWDADEATLARGYLRFHPNGRCEPSALEIVGPVGEPVTVASRAPHEAFAIRVVEEVWP